MSKMLAERFYWGNIYGFRLVRTDRINVFDNTIEVYYPLLDSNGDYILDNNLEPFWLQDPAILDLGSITAMDINP